MALYCGIFVWSVINSKIVRIKDRHNWLFYILVLLPPVLFATIRYRIGTDYVNYLYFFNGGIYSSSVAYEPLFRLLNYIAKRVFHDFYGVLLLSAVITYGFVVATLVRLKDELSISIGLWVFYCYYYVASLNVMRQMIAVAIVLYAIILLSERKKIKYLILVTIAAMFHISAVIAFVPFILSIAKTVRSKSWMYLLYFSAILAAFLGGYIINTLSGVLGEYSSYLTNKGSIVSGAYIVDIIPAFLVVALPIALYFRFYRKDDKYDLLCAIGLFSLVLLIMGYNFRWFMRAMYYFDIVQVPMWAINLKRIRLPQNKTIMKCFVILFYLFYFWYSSVYHGSNGGVPYQSLLF